MTASTQQQRRIRTRPATGVTRAAEQTNPCRTRQRASNRDSQPHHDHLQRIAVKMGRWLQSIADAAQNAVDQLKIREPVAEAFDSRERLYKHLVLHVVPQEADEHSTTGIRNRTYKLSRNRRCVASLQFYATRHTACYATYGSTVAVSA